MNRRDVLKGALVAAATTPVALAANAHPVTPRDRLNAAMKELKAAAEAFDPTIKHWSLSVSEDDSIPCRIVAAAFNW